MEALLEKYITYIKNTGRNGQLKTADFDEDWEPVGPMIRTDLVKRNLITISANNRITLVEEK